MNEQTQLCLQRFIENRDRIKSVFSWDSGLIHLSCAGIYTAKDKTVDIRMLQNCKDLLKQKVSVFSNFRSTARTPITAMMAVSENPEQTLDNGLIVYELLKKDFWGSEYLPLAAMIIAQMAQLDEYERIASRTRSIYNSMKAVHPFLTSSEDSALCALLSLSEQPDDVLLRDSEECYRILKPHFFSANAVQSLSHVLALCDGYAESKCERTMELFNKLKLSGYKYGTDYELPTLGILATSGGNLDSIVADIVEINTWLASQKGFGFFSSISTKQRLMYAGILAQKEYYQNDTMQNAAINGTISLIIAQEVAMCVAISASASASAAASD